MSERLWLDDMRRPPFGYTLWAKTYAECIRLLEEYGTRIEHVSLDHDLAEEHYSDALEPKAGYMGTPAPIDRSRYVEKTGYAVLEWMHEHNTWVPDISVHTLNPRGCDDMMNKLINRAPDHVRFRRVLPYQV